LEDLLYNRRLEAETEDVLVQVMDWGCSRVKDTGPEPKSLFESATIMDSDG
jgi:hypothetical protein